MLSSKRGAKNARFTEYAGSSSQQQHKHNASAPALGCRENARGKRCFYSHADLVTAFLLPKLALPSLNLLI
jgi:hypothetical protein